MNESTEPLSTQKNTIRMENGGRTMLIGAIARHTFKNLPGKTQGLVLIVVVINLTERSHSLLSGNGKVANELHSGRSNFP